MFVSLSKVYLEMPLYYVDNIRGVTELIKATELRQCIAKQRDRSLSAELRVEQLTLMINKVQLFHVNRYRFTSAAIEAL